MNNKATKIEKMLLEQVERSIADYENVPEDNDQIKLMYQWFAFGAITSAFLTCDITDADYVAYCNRVGIGNVTPV